jgi:hypothetical protein
MGWIAQAVGTGMQVGGQGRAGETQNAVGMYNQGVANKQAKEIEQKTTFDQSRDLEESKRGMSAMEVQQNAGGGGINLLAIAKQASENELQNLMIGREGKIAATAVRQEGKMARWQGRTAMHQGWLGGGGTAMSGFGQAYSSWQANQNDPLKKKTTPSGGGYGANEPNFPGNR